MTQAERAAVLAEAAQVRAANWSDPASSKNGRIAAIRAIVLAGTTPVS